jgi:hypothetical protein
MESMKRCILILLSIAMVLAASSIGLAQTSKPLTNDELLRLAKAGFDDEGLIKVVETSDLALDLSIDGLLALKSGGLSQKVINAALAAKAKKLAPATMGADSDALEVGVYMVLHDKPGQLNPETVNFRSGFAKINGTVKGPRSPAQVTGSVTLLVRCPEGVAASEYQLLKFDQKADRREFRLMTGHWSSVSTGDEKNNLPVTFDKIAPRTYKAVLNLLKPGEYGLLPPTANTNIGLGSVGKVYTFGIKE